MSGGVMAEEDIEYESDPEETKMSLKMRRREASDDEEEDGGEKPVRRVDDEFDGESEGAVPEYEDDLEEEDCYDLEEEEYVEEEIEEPNYGERGSEMVGGSVLIVPVKAAGVDGDMGEEIVVKNGAETNDEIGVDGGGLEEEKKEIEPYAVPTAGAFYMHDDRFQDNTRGRNRRMLGGRKLWESKDNRKWGHDMFEELTTSERTYEERRGSRGSFRGRGRNKGTGLGYARAYRSHNHSNSSSQNNNNHNNAPKRMRGRGPRRYQPSLKDNSEGSPTPNKQKSVEKPSYVTSVKTSESASNAEMSMILPRKQGFASNLSIASPPFYPSGFSTKHNAVEHKRDIQAGTRNRNSRQSAVDESFNGTQSSAMLKGKSIVDSIGIEKLTIDYSVSATAGKPSNNMHMLASSSLSTNAAQPQMRGHGRGETSSTKLPYQPADSTNQVNRVPRPNQRQTVPRYPRQTPAQSSVQTPDQQFARVSGGSHTSPPKVAVLESSKLDYPSEYSKSTTGSVATGTGKSNVQGRGSFLYGGAQVMGASGNLGAVHADQNFSAFLPVMQFGGKHPGGMGVPAVGMAFPGYVGQPQPGLGNSEMTWLPVIAGAAGAMGAQYCPPFISVDGSYHTQPSGKVSTITSASSKENKVVSAELANEESGLRQKNPRRYTEMKFDQ